MPLLFLVLLAAAREAIITHQPTALSQALGVLWREYTPHLFFWGVVELMRRVTLTGFVLLIGEEATLVRLSVALLVSCIAPLAVLVLQPYKHIDDNFLAVTLHVSLVFVFAIPSDPWRPVPPGASHARFPRNLLGGYEVPLQNEVK